MYFANLMDQELAHYCEYLQHQYQHVTVIADMRNTVSRALGVGSRGIRHGWATRYRTNPNGTLK